MGRLIVVAGLLACLVGAGLQDWTTYRILAVGGVHQPACACGYCDWED